MKMWNDKSIDRCVSAVKDNTSGAANVRLWPRFTKSFVSTEHLSLEIVAATPKSTREISNPPCEQQLGPSSSSSLDSLVRNMRFSSFKSRWTRLMISTCMGGEREVHQSARLEISLHTYRSEFRSKRHRRCGKFERGLSPRTSRLPKVYPWCHPADTRSPRGKGKEDERKMMENSLSIVICKYDFIQSLGNRKHLGITFTRYRPFCILPWIICGGYGLSFLFTRSQEAT